MNYSITIPSYCPLTRLRRENGSLHDPFLNTLITDLADLPVFNLYNNKQMNLRKDLEAFDGNPVGAPLSLLGQITTTITLLVRTLDEYESFIAKETINEEKKLKNETRLLNLRSELGESKEKFTLLKKKREQGLQDTGRTQLFERGRNGAGSDNPYDDTANQQPGVASSLSMQEGLLKEGSVLGRGNQQLDEILEMGRATFEDLVSQNEIIAKAQRKMTESLSTLGFSRATIRKIEKKAFEDKWIFYIGALFTFFCFWLIWRYLG
ncbi:unnamed protein product [Kuraishia capsulata CBS 1993]|uniref:Protein transport protein BOS1 n=1 Tax=Kuraishia capsulata CBS 1993 TaxID=1382522 RepID=W6MJP7_9ASCO|nr:uncharacterized protein KUCA_T00002184001 [Kuraishia capsulata CBS 1993]CDK26213.1 unnamed protein product [Kuraishia capsulata CBS 1993]